MHTAQRMGVVATSPADGVRVGRQNAEDTDRGM